MGKRDQLIRLVVVAFAFLTGCAPEAPPGESGESALGPDLEALPGGELGAQDIATNGPTLNGIATNGTMLNGIATNGMEIAGVSVTGVGLNATVFTGRTVDGTPMSGTSFVGTTMNGIKPDNSVLKLRIDAMTPLPAPNADLFGYTVSFDGPGGAKEYICGLDSAGQPVKAIPVTGTWNYGQGVSGGGSFTPSTGTFTFACRGMAIGKCIELGYRPWQAAPGGGTLQDHLNACTRALRADYCGNGKSYTLNGTLINLYDSASVQTDTESWPVEAEWTANGARFITTGTKKRYKLVGGDPPPCVTQLESSTTGSLSHFSSGTLIMTEYTDEILLTPPPRSSSRPRPVALASPGVPRTCSSRPCVEKVKSAEPLGLLRAVGAPCPPAGQGPVWAASFGGPRGGRGAPAAFGGQRGVPAAFGGLQSVQGVPAAFGGPRGGRGVPAAFGGPQGVQGASAARSRAGGEPSRGPAPAPVGPGASRKFHRQRTISGGQGGRGAIYERGRGQRTPLRWRALAFYSRPLDR